MSSPGARFLAVLGWLGRKKLLARRTVWLPTWRTLLALCALLVAVMAVGIGEAYPFLAVTRPTSGARTAIVEGWVSDEALPVVAERLRSGNYQRIVTTGGPVSKSSPLAEYKSYAALCAERLRRSGVSPDLIVAVPAPYVRTERTRESARAVAQRFAATGALGAVDLVSYGPHARRSWKIFQEELAPRPVGVIALPPDDYDPQSWWSTSAGARSVVGEAIAYAAFVALD
jgi:hypothetical protein